MRLFRTLTLGALSGTLVATAACTTNPYTGQREISRAAIGGLGGAVGGYLLGDIVGGRHDRTERILGAGIGALGGAAVGAYMDRQEAQLRRQTAGTGVDVVRQGDDLVLRMPSGITFPVDGFMIQPQFQGTLDSVAQTLASYDQTYIDVLGIPIRPAATFTTRACRSAARVPSPTISPPAGWPARGWACAGSARPSRLLRTTPMPVAPTTVASKSRSSR